MQAVYDFKMFLDRLSDEAIEALLYQVAQEELRRHSAQRS